MVQEQLCTAHFLYDEDKLFSLQLIIMKVGKQIVSLEGSRDEARNPKVKKKTLVYESLCLNHRWIWPFGIEYDK